MSFKLYQFYKTLILSMLCFLSCGAMLSGMLLGMVKSPETQAKIYLSLAQDNMHQLDDFAFQQSTELTLRALSYDPYNEKIWNNLAALKAHQENINLTQDVSTVAFTFVE